MGMGKSGHVGRKIAATLASTGTPALFVHPGEASHGDLGMVASRRRGAGDLQFRRERRIRRDRPGAQAPGRDPGRDDRPPRIDPGAACRHRPEQRGRPGSLPTEPRPDHQHHRPDGARRCAGGGAARRARLSRGGLRALAPRWLARPQAADARARPDAPRHRRAAGRPRGHLRRDAARDDRQGPGLHRRRGRGRPGAGHLHRRRPAPPDRAGGRPACPARRRRHARAAEAGARRGPRGRRGRP